MDLLPKARLDALLQAFGREVKADRVRRNWTREQLAKVANVSEKQVGKIERGERGQLSEAWRIAEALNRDFSAMVGAAESSVHQAIMAMASDQEAFRLLRSMDEDADRSDPSGTVDDAIAASEEGSIAGEQESRNET